MWDSGLSDSSARVKNTSQNLVECRSSTWVEFKNFKKEENTFFFQIMSKSTFFISEDMFFIYERSYVVSQILSNAFLTPKTYSVLVHSM